MARRHELDFDWLPLDRLWKWTREHPGTVMMGALLLAALVFPHSKSTQVPAPDSDTDEAPLFI